MRREKASFLAVLCALGVTVCGCGIGAQVGGAADGGLAMEGCTREENSRSQEDTQPQESAGSAVTDVNNTAGDGAVPDQSGELNGLGLDAQTMEVLKYNIYIELYNTIVEIMEDINNYFLVVDTADDFRFREDAEYSYGYLIKGFNMDAVEDAETVYNMEPAYETLDGVVADMLPSMREIMETFDAIHDSGYTYEQNQYQQPKENHMRLMACLDEFAAYASEYMKQVEIIVDEENETREARMLGDGRLIMYYYSHMITLASDILDEIYDQGIDDYNLTELDLTLVYPMYEEMQETAAAYEQAVSDNNQLMQESLSNRQVYAGDWNSLLQAFEWMIRQVESKVPYEDPSREYLGGLQHIYVVLSDKVESYNGIFVK